MAEIKKKKIISASTGEEVTGKKKIKEAAPTGSSVGYRIGAIVLWVLAFAFEVLAILVALGKFSFHFMPSLWQLIIFLVLDLICVVIGSLLWKKANHISPASEKNKVKFWLWNNLGVIVSVAAFVPFIIIMLSSKNNDKRTKAIATVVAIVALLIAGVCSILVRERTFSHPITHLASVKVHHGKRQGKLIPECLCGIIIVQFSGDASFSDRDPDDHLLRFFACSAIL